jgi:poly(3-hydroxybutyrate) depolymerase
MAFATLFALSFAETTMAQCDGSRYLIPIFNEVNVESDIPYGANLNSASEMQELLLDVYTPTGDTETNRPLIILAHGGSFVAGSKTGTDVVPLANDFAQLGYVTASIQYRLGATDPGQFLPTPVSVTKAVWRAVHDARAAIRFFRKSVEEEGNPYGIDPDRIFLAGVSAGGFIALHTGFLNSEDEIPQEIDADAPGLEGGIEGNTGNAGYSSEVTAIINIAGAIGDTAWMQASETPVLSFHGDADGTVPYGSETLVYLGFINLIEVDGSSSVHARAENLGLKNCFETHEGFDHVPHVTNASIYDTTFVKSRNWLFHFVCEEELNCTYGPAVITSADEPLAGQQALVFPNPATTSARINFGLSEGLTRHVRMFNATGQLVKDFGVVTNQILDVPRGELPAGLYLIQEDQPGKRQSIRLIFN